MTRVRLSVDVDPELRRRVKVAAASKEQSVKEWIEDVIRRELEQDRPGWGATCRVLGSLNSTSEEGELEEGKPVRYEPGVGFVVEGGRDAGGSSGLGVGDIVFALFPARRPRAGGYEARRGGRET